MSHMLLIDDRERAVFDHLDALTVPYKIQRFNVGDYALVRNTTTETSSLLVIFERKSYEDFAASVKDGRHGNKEKLIRAREQTNCKIFYIIEGAPFPEPSKRFSHVPYWIIESAIDHLMMRDQIYIIYTRDRRHTLERLDRFCKSIDRLENKSPIPAQTFGGVVGDVETNVNVSADADANTSLHTGVDTGADAGAIAEVVDTDASVSSVTNHQVNALDVLSEVQEKTPTSILLEVWTAIRGIGIDNAPLFAQNFTIAELCRGDKSICDKVSALRYKNGRALSKKLIATLCKITPDIERRMLANLPGISRDTAFSLLAVARIPTLLSYGIGGLSIITCGKRKLGDARAQTILTYFNAKLNDNGAFLT